MASFFGGDFDAPWTPLMTQGDEDSVLKMWDQRWVWLGIWIWVLRLNNSNLEIWNWPFTKGRIAHKVTSTELNRITHSLLADQLLAVEFANNSCCRVVSSLQQVTTPSTLCSVRNWQIQGRHLCGSYCCCVLLHSLIRVHRVLQEWQPIVDLCGIKTLTKKMRYQVPVAPTAALYCSLSPTFSVSIVAFTSKFWR